jgi:hypothetical protein
MNLQRICLENTHISKWSTFSLPCLFICAANSYYAANIRKNASTFSRGRVLVPLHKRIPLPFLHPSPTKKDVKGHTPIANDICCV